MSGVPIVVGVTGHRDLRSEDVPALEGLVRERLAEWLGACPHSDFYCLTSLAEGADQLVARVADGLGMRLLVSLPMELAEYEKDFSGDALESLRALLREAAQVRLAPDAEESDDGSRDYRYRQAGIDVARHCHVLIALWDSLPGKPSGCGTAEAVGFKLQKAYRASGALLPAPDEGVVLQAVTPRRRSAEMPEGALTARLIENAPGALDALLKNTDAFNRDAFGLDISAACDAFDAQTMEALGASAEPANEVYALADMLSLRFQRRYLRALKVLCALGALTVAAFLLYDVMESNLFLMFYALTALASFAVFLVSRYGRCHGKYIEYRLLAETLRVQLNLIAAGLDGNAEDLVPWSQRTLSPWIREAVNNMPRAAEGVPCARADVRAAWLAGQLAYHRRAVKKNAAKLKRQNVISGALLALTVLYSVAVVVLELLSPGPMGAELALESWLCRALLTHGEGFFTVRSVFKILLGLIPALTLVVSSYYGKLSLERKLHDGNRMIALYTKALEMFDNPATNREKLLTELAREELAETGGWLSYVSENTPEVLI